MTTYPSGPKSGWAEQARGICSGAIPLGSDDIPALFDWLQDANWPGAPEIAAFLIAHADEAVDRLRSIIIGPDLVWACWTIELVISQLPASACRALAPELLRLARGLDEEEAHLAALRVCVRHRLVSATELCGLLDQKMRQDPENAEAYQEMLEAVSR